MCVARSFMGTPRQLAEAHVRKGPYAWTEKTKGGTQPVSSPLTLQHCKGASETYLNVSDWLWRRPLVYFQLQLAAASGQIVPD